jgi:hypothetical protein
MLCYIGLPRATYLEKVGKGGGNVFRDIAELKIYYMCRQAKGGGFGGNTVPPKAE